MGLGVVFEKNGLATLVRKKEYGSGEKIMLVKYKVILSNEIHGLFEKKKSTKSCLVKKCCIFA